jgi:hypothetical protein
MPFPIVTIARSSINSGIAAHCSGMAGINLYSMEALTAHT